MDILHLLHVHVHVGSFCRYKEGRYPENMETVTISNISMMEVNVLFYFQRDHNATTFLLDPPDMTLQPGESKVPTQCCSQFRVLYGRNLWQRVNLQKITNIQNVL